MSETEPTPLRLGDAVRRLHESLPRWVNFSVGRTEAHEVQCDDRGERDPRPAAEPTPEWSVVVQRPDRQTGQDRYVRATLGPDLAAVVEQAIEHYRQWADSQPDADADADKPAKLAAPGAADRRARRGRRKDAS